MLYERKTISSAGSYALPLDVYCPHVSTEIDPDIQRPAIVICPGGGYGFLSEREAEPVALAFNTLGFNTFIVWYRVAPHRYPRPQQDVAAAVAWVRAHAAETHTHPDKIAVLGFSAGGHCAGSLGVWWPKAELWAEMGEMLLPIIIAIIPVTVLVMVTAGKTTQALTSRKKSKEAAADDGIAE